MLRLLAIRSTRRAVARTTSRAFASTPARAQAPVLDYGSYKNNLFTHRLPESTAQQLPALVALHSRLRLPEEFTLSTLLQALNARVADGLANNFGLSTLGKTLMLYYVAEHLVVTYPRLPMAVHNAAVNAYMGHEALAQIGKGWGIEPDHTLKLAKYLAKEPEAAEYGRLRFLAEEVKEEPTEAGISEVETMTKEERETHGLDQNESSLVPREQRAYASAVKAVVGGLYTHCGEEAAKQFVLNHVLLRKVPVEQMFQFSRPTRELTRVLDKLAVQEPLEVRLMAETGRLSAHAIYVAGAFAGGDKLGEGVGSSVNEAKTRAVVSALMAYYLYLPVTAEGLPVAAPSDAKYTFEGYVGTGDVAI